MKESPRIKRIWGMNIENIHSDYNCRRSHLDNTHYSLILLRNPWKGGGWEVEVLQDSHLSFLPFDQWHDPASWIKRRKDFELYWTF